MMLGESYPAKPEDASIEMFRTQRPEQKYVEIAEFKCNDTNDRYAMNQVLKKARELGADGIIILGKAGSGGVGVPIGASVYISSDSYGVIAVAFKYIE